MKTRSVSFARGQAFTLVELMVAISVMILLLLMVFGMVDQTQKTYSRASAQANQFREARVAFESITRRVRQAALNTYFDYERAGLKSKPKKYIRQSELHFVCGPTATIARKPEAQFPGHSVFFQAPFGYTDNQGYQSFTEMMNAWGYFVEFGDDSQIMPEFLRSAVQPKFRYRMWEFRLPAEDLKIYQDAKERRKTRSGADSNWFIPYLQGGEKAEAMRRVVAENIIGIIITPLKGAPQRGSKSSDLFYPTGFYYDSRIGVGEAAKTGVEAANDPNNNVHLLPSLLRITMIAIDEKTAVRYDRGGAPPNLIPSSVFKQPNSLDADLVQLASAFQDMKPKVDYRIFNSMVSLREANWIDRNPK